MNKEKESMIKTSKSNYLILIFSLIILTHFVAVVGANEMILSEFKSTIEFAKILEYEVDLAKVSVTNQDQNTFLSVKVQVKKNKGCTTKVRAINPLLSCFDCI